MPNMSLNKFRSALFFVFLFSCFLVTKADALAEASFSLSPSSGVCIPDGTFDLDIILQSDEPSSGATAIVTYENNFLEVVSVSPGNIFPMLLVKSVTDKGSNTGTIRLDIGVTPADPQYFSGEGVFGTVTFKALEPSSVLVDFLYYADSTTDSNVADAETHDDILTSVAGGTYHVRETNDDPNLDPSCVSGGEPTPTPTTPPGAPTPTPTTAPGTTPTPTPTTAPGGGNGATPTPTPTGGGESPGGGVLGPTVFISLLGILMIGAGFVLR